MLMSSNIWEEFFVVTEVKKTYQIIGGVEVVEEVPCCLVGRDSRRHDMPTAPSRDVTLRIVSANRE